MGGCEEDANMETVSVECSERHLTSTYRPGAAEAGITATSVNTGSTVIYHIKSYEK